MNTPVKQYNFTFISDGVSLIMTVDVSLAPFNEDFAGNLPQAVLEPDVVSDATGDISTGLTASLLGTQVTFTFPAAPPQYDGEGNLIVYSASFLLEFGVNPAYIGTPNFNNPRQLTGTVNGTNKVFALPSQPQGSIIVTIPTGTGGALFMTPGVDYTILGLAVTFTNAPTQTPLAYY